MLMFLLFFFSSRRLHTRCALVTWSSDVCSSDLKDNIERAIKRAAGGEDDTNYEEIRYEGYGPGGVAVIVEALTDNRNRTAGEVRSAFTKYGGTLGEKIGRE